MDFLNNLFVNLNQAFAEFLKGFLPGWAADLIVMIVAAAVLAVFAIVMVLIMLYMERKVVGRMQDRPGPNRVGPLGTLQPIADMIKILTKEDITPRVAHRWVYNLAPILVVPPAVLALAVIPIGRGMVGTNLNIGFLYIIAVTSTATIALFMAGWGSRNKYALLGAMRAAAQIVSYEIPQVLSVVGVLMIAGSLSLVKITEAQGPLWFIFLQPVGFLIFLIASVAELNRTPFDIPEAESEIVAGHHIEYSGLKFGMFYVGEYINTFGVSAVATVIFLGGWQGPILPPYIWFLLKVFLMIFVIMWLRGTLPRLRVDQLMNFAWKILVPLALGNVLTSSIAAYLTAESNTFVRLVGFAFANVLLLSPAIILLSLRQPEEPAQLEVQPGGAVARP